MIQTVPSIVTSNTGGSGERNLDTQDDAQRPDVIAIERAKAAAKLVGQVADDVPTETKRQAYDDVSGLPPSMHAKSMENRLSKESGIGSSVNSSLDETEGDDESSSAVVDHAPASAPIPTRVVTDDPEDRRTATVEREILLDIIAEEEETRSTHSDPVDNRIIEKHVQLRGEMMSLDNLSSPAFGDHASTVETDSTVPDTESTVSGERDSIQSGVVPSVVDSKQKNSFRRKNSGRSIFSVLSTRSSRSSPRNSFGTSVSDPEDDYSQARGKTVGGLSKTLGRSPFGSLSSRKRSSKVMSLTSVNDNSTNSHSGSVPPSPATPGTPGSPGDKQSKAAKLLGLSLEEEKVLLEKPEPILFDLRTSSESSLEDEQVRRFERSYSTSAVTPSNKAEKLLGITDVDLVMHLDQKSKATRLLGLNEGGVRRGSSMYLAGFVSGAQRSSATPQLTVSKIQKNVVFTGFLSRHQSGGLRFSKAWRRRYFILAKTTLYCFKNDEPNTPMLDCIELTGNTVVCVTDTFSGRSWVLEVSKEGSKPWFVQAQDVEDMKSWMTVLKTTVVKCKYSDVPSKTRLSTDVEDPLSNITTTTTVSSVVPATASATVLSASAPTISALGMVGSDHVARDLASLPPPPRSSPQPLTMTSLPPPPRPRSGNPPLSGPPSPTAGIASRPLSPQHTQQVLPADVVDLAGNNEVHTPPRTASPVGTLSLTRSRTPRTRPLFESQATGISSHSAKPRARTRPRSSSFSSVLRRRSPSASSVLTPSSPHEGRRTERRSRTTQRPSSPPPVMPSWSIRTMSPPPSLASETAFTTASDPLLSPPRRPPPPSRPPPSPPRAARSGSSTTPTRVRSTRSTSHGRLHSSPSTSPPHSPTRARPTPNRARTLDGRPPPLRGPPPSSPLPLPPLKTNSTVSAPSSPRSKTSQFLLEPVRPGTGSPPTSPRSPERSHTSPNMFDSPRMTPPRPRSPWLRSTPSTYQSIPILFPAHMADSIPPPRSRPPKGPLPPPPPRIQTSSSSKIMPMASLEALSVTTPSSPHSEPAVERSDDDELDPDYAKELEDARRRSQKSAEAASEYYDDPYPDPDAEEDASIELDGEEIDTHKRLSAVGGVRVLLVAERASTGDFELVAHVHKMRATDDDASVDASAVAQAVDT